MVSTISPTVAAFVSQVSARLGAEPFRHDAGVQRRYRRAARGTTIRIAGGSCSHARGQPLDGHLGNRQGANIPTPLMHSSTTCLEPKSA